MAFKNQAHRERYEKKMAARAERKRLEDEAKAKRNQKKASQRDPRRWIGLKKKGWYARIGAKNEDPETKVKIRKGLFYCGAGVPGDLVEPRLDEPSLVDTKHPIGLTSEDMEPLPAFPCFEYLSPSQRRGYVEFLASDRSDARDIGFVFMYLYGLERRLIVDARKPGTVSEAERDEIVAELLRLLDCFGEESRSLCHYIGMLLLYDGSVFGKLSEDEVSDVFGLDDLESNRMKLYEASDNAVAMPYLMLSRLSEHGWHVPEKLKILAAKGRLVCSHNFPATGISRAELYVPELDELLAERFANATKEKASSERRSRYYDVEHPSYMPASPSIRREPYRPVLNTAVCPDPEDLGIPLKRYADMVLAAKRDLDYAKGVLKAANFRGVEKVKLDALAVASKPDCALDTFLEHKHKDLAGHKSRSLRVSMQVVEDDFRRRTGAAPQFTSKGRMAPSAQQMLAAATATFGWQAILPEAIECPVSSYWRVEESSSVVLFDRQRAHNTASGVRCLSPVFGGDTSSFSLTLPASWDDACRYAYIFAWFVAKCPGSFSSDDLVKLPSECYPEFDARRPAMETAQIQLFFSLVHACYSMSKSSRGIKACLDYVPFDKVQLAVFSLCKEKFGRNLPSEVMEALEAIYTRAGRDKVYVLHDYQSGDYHTSVNARAVSEFFIDEDRLAETIADTSSVHNILNEAIGAGTDDEIVLDAEVGQDGSGTPPDARHDGRGKDGGTAVLEPEPQGESAGSVAEPEGGFVGGRPLGEARELVCGLFDGSDEMPASELAAGIMAAFGTATQAEALAIVTELNDAAGEELVEVDGADAYLN